MPDSITVTWFDEKGAYSHSSSHRSINARVFYQQTIDQFSTSKEKVLVLLRNQNEELLLPAWSNITEEDMLSWGIKKKPPKNGTGYMLTK